MGWSERVTVWHHRLTMATPVLVKAIDYDAAVDDHIYHII